MSSIDIINYSWYPTVDYRVFIKSLAIINIKIRKLMRIQKFNEGFAHFELYLIDRPTTTSTDHTSL